MIDAHAIHIFFLISFNLCFLFGTKKQEDSRDINIVGAVPLYIYKVYLKYYTRKVGPD